MVTVIILRHQEQTLVGIAAALVPSDLGTLMPTGPLFFYNLFL